VLDQGKGLVMRAGDGFGFDTASEILACPAWVVGKRSFRKLGDPSAVFSLMDEHEPYVLYMTLIRFSL
jgi:hypothetical protein